MKHKFWGWKVEPKNIPRNLDKSRSARSRRDLPHRAKKAAPISRLKIVPKKAENEDWSPKICGKRKRHNADILFMYLSPSMLQFTILQKLMISTLVYNFLI